MNDEASACLSTRVRNPEFEHFLVSRRLSIFASLRTGPERLVQNERFSLPKQRR
jgi:hypothetical protein